ncbi:MAG: prepilin-type N-terminal cleavage/methylation domain-containing protein [Sandaracinaceae bacterium]
MQRKIVGGFTLLEVIVAVAILGIAMTAILSSEAGAVRTGARATHMTTATLLARCKMGEIEEQMAVEGFPAVDADGEDECCEGGEMPGFRCEWNVERVELPDAVSLDGEEGDPLGLGGDHAGDEASGVDLENALSGAAGGDAIGSYAVQFAWPVIRPAIEEQVRRATVTVIWNEGSREQSFDIVQYLVSNAPPNTDPDAVGAGGTTPTTPGLPAVPTIPTVRLPGQQQ